MFRLFGKIVKRNNIINSYVIEMHKENHSLEHLLIKGIEELCYKFDIGNPIGLSNIVDDMSLVNKTRFKAHHFIEEIDFDYFEVEYLAEKE